MRRRAFLGAALAAAASGARGAPRTPRSADDFEALWQEIDAGYAYFDGATRARWSALRSHGRAMAARASSGDALAQVLEHAIAQLRDDHVTIVGSGAPSARRIPYDLDIWPRWRGGVATIEAVRTFGDADVAGLHAGQLITRIQDVPVEAAVRQKLGATPGSVAEAEWALRRVIAGPRVGVQRLEIRDADRVAVVGVERTKPTPSTSPAFIARRMGMAERDIGYIRVRVGAADDLSGQFAAALPQMSGARALILDLRESSEPAGRDATLAILSHFARVPMAWQVREAPGKPRVTDMVSPSGSAFAAPVAVLVDRWTAGEGEALAAGLVAVARAELVGTPMAGLRGEIREVQLPASGLTLRYPRERTYVAGRMTPREALRPTLSVDLAAPSGGPGDPILYQALKLFERR